MAIIDIKKDGGAIPMPGDDAALKMGNSDSLADMEATIMRADKFRVWREAAGFAPKSPAAPQERLGIDVGQIISALTNQTTALMSKLTEITMANKDNQSNPLLAHMMEELKEARADLRDTDPWMAITTTQERYGSMLSQMKKDLGISDSVKTTTSDVPQMLQLEGLKLEREERQRQFSVQQETSSRQWTAEQEDKHRRWLIEDRRWEADFGLKKQEFEKNASIKNNALSEIGDLVGAFVSGIQEDKAEFAKQAPAVEAPPFRQRTPAPAKAAPEPPLPGPNYHCDGCNSDMFVPDHITQFNCPKCNQSHTMSRSEAPTSESSESLNPSPATIS